MSCRCVAGGALHHRADFSQRTLWHRSVGLTRDRHETQHSRLDTPPQADVYTHSLSLSLSFAGSWRVGAKEVMWVAQAMAAAAGERHERPEP